MSYSVLVLDNTSCTPDPANCLFWYRADPGSSRFTMCSRVYWKLQAHPPPRTRDGALDRGRGADGGVSEVKGTLSTTLSRPFVHLGGPLHR